jgi:hypothetical protein
MAKIRKDNSFRFLWATDERQAWFDYCEAIGVVPSEHAREIFNAEVALYEASKAK